MHKWLSCTNENHRLNQVPQTNSNINVRNHFNINTFSQKQIHVLLMIDTFYNPCVKVIRFYLM